MGAFLSGPFEHFSAPAHLFLAETFPHSSGLQTCDGGLPLSPAPGGWGEGGIVIPHLWLTISQLRGVLGHPKGLRKIHGFWVNEIHSKIWECILFLKKDSGVVFWANESSLKKTSKHENDFGVNWRFEL